MPTPDRTLTCAAPNLRSYRSGGDARSLLSWFGASIRQCSRARWAPASPCMRGGWGPASSKQSSHFGRAASRTLSPCRALPHVEADTPSVEQGPSCPTLNVVAHRLDPVRQSPPVEVNFATPQCLLFERGHPASIAAAASAMVRKPLTTLMATVLCNLLTFWRLRRLAIKSSAQIGLHCGASIAPRRRKTAHSDARPVQPKQQTS